MKKKLIILINLVFSLNIMASSIRYKHEEGSCIPFNQLNFNIDNKSLGGLSETDFNFILDQVETVMAPIIKMNLNKNLIIDRLWADGTVDAHTTRDDSNNPVIVINGGLARHPLMTKDGFLLLICHELGHHLGGAPKILRGASGLRGWSSAEGQADYYATMKCLPQFFQQGPESKNVDYERGVVNQNLVLSKCNDSICARTVLSGLAVSQFFASLVKGTPEPSLLVNDPVKVEKTFYKHPNPQCRLDTYLSGANCDVGIGVPFDLNDPKIGACLKDQGARPMCWYQEKDFI